MARATPRRGHGAARRRLGLIALALGVGFGPWPIMPEAEAGCREVCTWATDCDQLSGDERWRCVANRAGASGDVCETVCTPQHGAIAYSRETGPWGYAYDHDSAARATRAALGNCAKYADDCAVALSVVDQCGALAETKQGETGTGTGGTRADAEADALAACRKDGADCSLVAWVCSGV